MDCPLNDRSIPADDKSVSEIITDYANNQVNKSKFDGTRQKVLKVAKGVSSQYVNMELKIKIEWRQPDGAITRNSQKKFGLTDFTSN